MRAFSCGLIFVVLLISLALPTFSFNLEPRESVILSDPTISSRKLGDRESYFGFSVALHYLANERQAWLVVGAPRANSSYYDADRITEPGAIFKCDLRSKECEELFIDQEGNDKTTQFTNEFSYLDLKNGGWLGAALDSQPKFEADRQAVGVCAPRWKNQLYSDTYLMNGACYWLNSSLPNAPAHKKLPLVQYSRQTYKFHNRALFYYSHGEAGLSVHFPEDPTEMVVGAPGVFNWRGSVIRFRDTSQPPTGNISRRRRRRQAQVHEDQMFAGSFVPNPYHSGAVSDFDLLGYSVTSGKFISRDKILYAAGAPRGSDSLGKVLVFSFPQFEESRLHVHFEWSGIQIGENFGASLVAADINGDGLSDLVVGAPMFSIPEAPDMGRIMVYQSLAGGATLEAAENLYGLSKPNSRFGTTLAACGDLNQDGFQDIAVGSPWEDDGAGAVYIYLGSFSGLRPRFAQHLQPKDFPQLTSGLGMAISRGIDIDGNGYPDLAIGSFLSGHAAVLRSRPVAYIQGFVSTVPSTIALDATTLELKACFDYWGYRVPQQVGLKGNITLDHEFFPPRAYFADNNAFTREFEQPVSTGTQECQTFTVKMKADKIDARKPILIKLDWELDQSKSSSLMSHPALDPSQSSSTKERVGIVTGCEDDGDDTCRVDLRVETTISSQTTGFVIGSDERPTVTVTVFNTGEPVFLPKVTVSVEPPLALNLPATRTCDFPSTANRTHVTCRLKNPIMKEEKDEVDFTIDVSALDDRATRKGIQIEVSGEGTEIRPQDNVFEQALAMSAKANIELHGYSKEEQILYERLEKDKINTTKTPRFLHYYSLVKNGPTPLGEVEFVVDIPVNITSKGKTETFVNIYHPQTNFNNQGFLCNLRGATYIVDDEDNGDIAEVPLLISNNTQPDPNRQSPTNTKPEQRATSMKSKDMGVKLTNLNCSNPIVSCARLSCTVNSWPASTGFADLTIRMSLNLNVLAGHISAQGGAVVKTSARAKILSLNPALQFIGEKETSFVVVTQVQPDSLPGKGVPWWVILLAVLGGLLLLCLVAYGLYKAGFFKRKEQEEMKAHRATVGPNDQGNANPGLVGD